MCSEAVSQRGGSASNLSSCFIEKWGMGTGCALLFGTGIFSVGFAPVFFTGPAVGKGNSFFTLRLRQQTALIATTCLYWLHLHYQEVRVRSSRSVKEKNWC